MTPAREIAMALGGRRARRGSYLVSCPVPCRKGRRDRNPSLRIGDGHIRLLTCSASCAGAAFCPTSRAAALMIWSASSARVKYGTLRVIHAGHSSNRTYASLDGALAGHVMRFLQGMQ